jgi:hypothetical protein
MGDTTLQAPQETPQVWLTLPGTVSRPAHRRRGAIQRNVRLDHMPTYRLPERECHAEHTPPLPATDEAECPWLTRAHHHRQVSVDERGVHHGLAACLRRRQPSHRAATRPSATPRHLCVTRPQ